jgi:hypothetical protein
MIITGTLFEIKIDDQNISSSAQSNVKRIQLKQQVNQSSSLKIYFSWDYYYNLKEKFTAGKKIQLCLPFRNNLVPVFNGIITGMFWESDYISGHNLRVEARDDLLKLQYTGFEFSMEKYSLLQLIREIVTSSSFKVAIENVVDVQERFVIPASTKLGALTALCEEFGLYFYLHEKKLAVFSPEQIPYDPMDLEINPFIQHILSNSATDSVYPVQEKYTYLLERNEREAEIFPRMNLFKIGGKNESDDRIIENVVEGLTVSGLSSYYQSRYKDLRRQKLTSRSLQEKMECRIPGNPLIHPGMIIRIRDDHFFLTEVFVKKAIHQLDHLGFTSTIECFANSRR